MPAAPARRRWELLLAVALVCELSVAGTAAVRLDRPHACSVVSHSSTRLARDVDAACESAVPLVTSVWGRDWAQTVQVVIPRNAQELEQQVLGGGDLQEVAAVVDEHKRVVINPDAFGKLSPTGRRVVLAHEVAHLASDAVRRPVPTWLAEGFADYIGFLHAGLPVTRAAAELALAVQSGDLPNALPSDGQFDGPDLPSLYQQSWLAAALLARLKGQAALVRLYRAVRAGASVDAALRREGLTTSAFTRSWRADLRRQLG